MIRTKQTKIDKDIFSFIKSGKHGDNFFCQILLCHEKICHFLTIKPNITIQMEFWGKETFTIEFLVSEKIPRVINFPFFVFLPIYSLFL